MNMIKQGQMRGVEKGDILGQVARIARGGPRPFVGGSLPRGDLRGKSLAERPVAA